jgi:hypothetical protein
MKTEKVASESGTQCKYTWSDEFGTHVHLCSGHESGQVRDLKYKDDRTGKNTRIYFGRPDTRTYTWTDDLGSHVFVINCQKLES